MALPLLCALAVGVGTTDLTFVRHSETIANATGKYNSKTIDTFSVKGEELIAQLTPKLMKEKRWDIILVSPSPRALKTIAPYLKATNQRAVVWPLLYECCTGKRPKDAHPTKFSYGSEIKVPSMIKPLFQIPKDSYRFPVSPDYNAGLAQVQATVAEFKKKYLGKRVLVVGHSGHGGQFLKAFTGKSIHVENAKPIHAKF